MRIELRREHFCDVDARVTGAKNCEKYFVLSIAHSIRSISQLISQINRDFNQLRIFLLARTRFGCLSTTHTTVGSDGMRKRRWGDVWWEWMEERENFFSFINNKLRCSYCVLCLQCEESLTSSHVLLVFAWGPNNETQGKFSFFHIVHLIF